MGRFKRLFHHHHHDKSTQSDPTTPSQEQQQEQPQSAPPTTQSTSAGLGSGRREEKQVLLPPLLEEHQSAFTNDSEEEPRPRSRLAKLMRHDAYKFTAAVLSLGLLVAIAMTLYYYVVPILTQGSELKMRHLGIYDPSDEAFMLHADMQVLLAKNPFNLEIRTVKAQLVNGEGKVAGFVQVPSIEVSGSEASEVSMRVPFRIADEQAFESMLVSMIKREGGGTPTVRAIADVRSKRFPVLGMQLTLDKHLITPNPKDGDDSKLPFRFDVLDTELQDSKNGLEVMVKVAIEADVPLAASIPAAKFWLSYEGVQVGQVVTAEPLTIHSGRSVVHLIGRLLNPREDPVVARSIGKMLAEYMHGEAPKVILKGDSTDLDLPARWMHTALNAVEFPFFLSKTSGMNAAGIKSPLKSVQLSKLHIGVEGNTVTLSVAAAVDLSGNPQMRLEPHEVSANAVLSLSKSAAAPLGLLLARTPIGGGGSRRPVGGGRGNNSHGAPVTPLSTPAQGSSTLLAVSLPTQKFQKLPNGTFSIDSSIKVTLSDANVATIKKALNHFVTRREPQVVHLSTYYTVNAHMNNVLINLQNKQLAQDLTVPSINDCFSELQLDSQPINDVEVIDANPEELKLRIGFPLTGPLSATEVTLDIGAIPVEILHKQQVIGRASLLGGSANKVISRKVNVEATLLKSSASQDFVTAFVNGIPTAITIRGDASGEGVRDLFKPFMNLSLPNIPIANQPQRLLHQVSLVSSAKSVWPMAYITATNPFAVPIHVLGILNMQVHRSDSGVDTYITTIDADPLDPPMVIPPKMTSTSPSPCSASYKGELKDGLRLLPDLLRHKDVRVRMFGAVRVRLGRSYELEIPYEQSNVPLLYTVQLTQAEGE